MISYPLHVATIWHTLSTPFCRHFADKLDSMAWDKTALHV